MKVRSLLKNIFIILIAFVLSASTFACSAERPEAVLKEYFDSLHSLDYATANALIDAGEKDSIDPFVEKSEFNDCLFGKLNYEILNTKRIDKQTFSVTVMIDQISMREIYSQVINKYSSFMMEQAKNGVSMDDQQMKAYIDDAMLGLVKEGGLKSESFLVDVKLTRKDDTWYVYMEKPLLNALFGGLIEAMDALISSK